MGNPENRTTCAAFENESAPIIALPGEKIVLTQTFLQHRVVDDDGGLVSQTLPSHHDAPAKLTVFVAEKVVATTAQILSKITVVFKHRFSKSHVGAERRLVQFNRFGT